MSLTAILDTPGPKELDDLGCAHDEALLSEFRRFGRLSAEEQAQVRRELGPKYSWWLLGFAERMASLAVRRASRDVLVTGMVGLSLYDQSSIDERDALVVCALCLRAGELLGLDRAALLALVEPHADPIGRAWLASYKPSEPVSTPATHEETGAGASFAFARRPQDHDPEVVLADLIAYEARRYPKRR